MRDQVHGKPDGIRRRYPVIDPAENHIARDCGIQLHIEQHVLWRLNETERHGGLFLENGGDRNAEGVIRA